MIFLCSLELKPHQLTGFPFDLPLIRTLPTVKFDTPVTFLVGANGSGKSTLLEALAAASQRTAAGNSELTDDDSLAAARRLAAVMRLGWAKRTSTGFFLRAEDFFGYVRRLNRMQHELTAEAQQLRQEYEQQGRSGYATGLALGALRGQAANLLQQYESLEQRSHGESYLEFLTARLQSGGLYLLDEPETPLSPQNQLTLMLLLHQAVAAGSQFVIATHSPLLLAYPEATIYNFDQVPLTAVEYEALEHVKLTRDFLNNPEAYLRRLLTE